jgi:hypothetical protein
MAKLDKVLAIYDAQGNRQAIPLYSSLEDVKNLGRKIYYSPTEFAYYPLTEKLDDPNASKKVVVIGTKTYKALLKVGGSGFKNILEAVDALNYMSAENSHKLDDIDRSIGSPVYIHSDANLDDYDFSSMYSDGTRVEIELYDPVNPKYINSIDLTPYNSLVLSSGMAYSIPTKTIKYNNIKSDGSLEAVMAIPYTGDRIFKGPLMKNTYDKCVFTGAYNESIHRIIEDMAQSPLANRTYISGSSNKVEQITLGEKEANEVKVDPFNNTAKNVMQITNCKIKETDKWQFAFLIYHGNKNDNTYNTITPYTEIESQTKDSLKYIYKLSKNDIKDDVNIKSCNNPFGSIVVLTRPGSYGYSASGALNAVKKLETAIIILDTAGTEVFRKDIVIHKPLKASIDKDHYIYNFVNAPYYTQTKKINIWIDYDSDFKDEDNFYVKLLFGNDIIHTIQIYQDYVPSVSIKNILSTVQSDRYLTIKSCNNVESLYATLTTTPRYINPNVYKYKGIVGIKFDIENITDFKRNPVRAEDLVELNKKRTLAIYTSDINANKNLNTNKDLFLFNMLNIMNQPGYTGAKDCVYIQQTIMAPESQLESVMNTKANADISNISYYPLRLNEI